MTKTEIINKGFENTISFEKYNIFKLNIKTLLEQKRMKAFNKRICKITMIEKATIQKL